MNGGEEEVVFSPTNGQIIALCTSPTGGVPKYPQPRVTVCNGFEDDFHAGLKRISRRTRLPIFNDRQISIVAQEVYDALNAELGTTLIPGDFAENITTTGLGDLSHLEPGDMLLIPAKPAVVLLCVTEQNIPCGNLLKYHPLMTEKCSGRRGVLAIVQEGNGVRLEPGCPISIVQHETYVDLMERTNHQGP